MTVSAVGFSGPTFIQLPGNGAATSFSFPFLITAATDINVGLVTGGVYVSQSTAAYTVSGVGNVGGGQITLAVAPPFGTLVDIRSVIPETQPTNFANLGGYLPESTTSALDRSTRNIADLYRLTYTFGVHGPDTEGTPWPALPVASQRANMLLGFDGNGSLALSTGSGGGGGGGGTPGANAVVLSVTAPALQVPCTTAGVVTDFSQAVGNAVVYSGSTNVTLSSSFQISNQTNCTASITAGGGYSFSALTQNVGTITILAIFNAVAYTIQVTISKQIPGAAGANGSTGPAGPAGAGGITMVLSNPAATVLAYANGGVPSFAGISGQARLLNAGVDISASATWSAVASGLTGTVNTATGVPVGGQPIGYYQVTAMTQTIGTLTISAVFSGSTITQVFVVTQVPTGYQIVSSLPVSGPALFQGNVVFLTTDNQLYRYTGTAWTAVVPAVNITGNITTTQIAPGSITTPLLAANSVTAAQIAANTITAGQIAVGGLTTNTLAAGAVTAAKIGVTQLSAIAANIGAVTAGTVSNASGSAIFDLNNGFIEFNNGVFMFVSGVGFGAASNYIQWFGPTQSSSSNFAACTDALGIYWIKTDGTYKFGAATQASSTTTFTGPITTSFTIPSGKQQMIVELFAESGLGGHGDGSTPGGGGASGGLCKSIFNVSSSAGLTCNLNLTGGGSGATSTVSSGTFAIATMNAVGGGNGTVGAGGSAGIGGSASGGNTINQGGFDGGNANSTRARGQGVSGTYGSGNPGAQGVVSATTNNPGLPALCYVTFI